MEKSDGRCQFCRYSDRVRNSVSEEYIECHRHAPTPCVGGGFMWPLVRVDDWCGDHVRSGELKKPR